MAFLKRGADKMLAHHAGRIVQQKPHGVERFPGRTKSDEKTECFQDLRKSGADGFQDVFIFRDVAHAFGAADKMSVNRRNNFHAVVLEAFYIFLRKLMAVHFFVHRRRDHKRRFTGQRGTA